MRALVFQLIAGVLLIVLVSSCEKNIYEAGEASFWSNDWLHGDLIGTVKQHNSGAEVVVSQLEPVETTLIDPTTGDFGMYELRTGNYDLTIQADNYRTYVYKNVMINPGGSFLRRRAMNTSMVFESRSNSWA